MSDFRDYFLKCQHNGKWLGLEQVHSCPELIDAIRQVGFLPLLEGGIPGFCAEGLMAEECRFTKYDDGSWEWPLWQWKSAVVTEGNCVYGKFFAGKAGFISREWWPDFYNWRRSNNSEPEEDSIEGIILYTLRLHGSMIARDLRAACEFTGHNMRSKFDAFINRMQMACLIVTEDFVYPTDKYGQKYGFGWSLLTTPEQLLGVEACVCDRTPEESYRRMFGYLRQLLPEATEKQVKKILG